MSFYLGIQSLGNPANIALDESHRHMFSVNFDVLARGPVSSLEDEILNRISSQGLGTAGVDTFIGRGAVMPDGDGPITTIIDTGGAAPLNTRDKVRIERRSFQIVVRGADYLAAQNRINAIWRDLDNKLNESLT